MKTEEIMIGEKNCCIYRQGEPRYLLLQPSDDHEMQEMQEEAEIIAETYGDFLFCIFRISDWNRELSPWDAPPVFGKEGFGHGAADTLNFVTEELIPGLINEYHLSEDIPVILGGYSLAAFFALWSAYQTDRFSAVSAASPSVWFLGWIDYAEHHPVKTEHVYLSLGNKEEKTRNQVMAQVGNCIRKQHELLSGIDCTLEWNEGNHFRDAGGRCARGFAWCLQALKGN